MPRLAALALIAPLALATLAGCGDDPEPREDGAAQGEISPELESALGDVESLAVQLESFYRGGDYPRTVEEVVGTLDDAGLELSEGNQIGAYTYDADAVEFNLCVQNGSGAWGTYDTAPMSLRESGESGGCPAS